MIGFLRRRYVVVPRAPSGASLDPTPFRYWRKKSASSMAGHLTLLASCRHNDLIRPPIEYRVRRIRHG
jgi:hypothetical protein